MFLLSISSLLIVGFVLSAVNGATPGSFAFYLQNGAVDVIGTVGVVMTVVQVTKTWLIDSWLPTSKPVHDSVVQSYAVALSLATVAILYGASPGFHNTTDLAVTLLSTIVAAGTEFGIYGIIRQGIPATPTTRFLNRVSAHPGVVDRVSAMPGVGLKGGTITAATGSAGAGRRIGKKETGVHGDLDVGGPKGP